MKYQENVYQIKEGLLEIKPLIWRRFLIPSKVSLYRLHLVLQGVMGWKNYHLYQFRIGKKEYGEPDLDDEFDNLDFIDARRAKLENVIQEAGSIFLYVYDFGDNWEHQMIVEDIYILDRDSKKKYPVCIAGENACPPDDSGGAHGYTEMMEIIRNPSHEEYRSTKTWLGKGFNPIKFDINAVNKGLSKMQLK